MERLQCWNHDGTRDEDSDEAAILVHQTSASKDNKIKDFPLEGDRQGLKKKKKKRRLVCSDKLEEDIMGLQEKAVNLGDDSKDVWVFDIDETSLSKLPYYVNDGYGLLRYKIIII